VDEDLAELPMTPTSKRKMPTKKAVAAASKAEKTPKEALTEEKKKKKAGDDVKIPSNNEKKGADAKKPPRTSEKQSSKRGKDASLKEKMPPPPTMGDIAAKEKRKRDEIQQSQQQQQQQQQHSKRTKKKEKQQSHEQIERGLKKKKKSKKARKREREARAKEMGEEGTAAKKAKVIPSTQTAINGTTKWSFGDWTCRKCGAHNYRKQKDKCFRCSYPKAIETNMKQGNHAAREYLNGKLKDDKNWTFSNQEHEWCVRNASFDPLMKDDVYDLFLKYLTLVDAKHRDRVRDGANVVIYRMKRALTVLKEFPTHAEEVITRRINEGQGAPDGEKKKKKKKRNRKRKKKDKDGEKAEEAQK